MKGQTLGCKFSVRVSHFDISYKLWISSLKEKKSRKSVGPLGRWDIGISRHGSLKGPVSWSNGLRPLYHASLATYLILGTQGVRECGISRRQRHSKVP